METAVTDFNAASSEVFPGACNRLEPIHSIAEKKRKMTLNLTDESRLFCGIRKRRSVITSLSSVSPSSTASIASDDDMAFLPVSNCNAAFLLSSPDINMLKMSSPELERIIIQGLITGSTSWTPTNSLASLLASPIVPASSTTFTTVNSTLSTEPELSLIEADVFAKFLNDLQSPTFSSLMITPTDLPSTSFPAYPNPGSMSLGPSSSSHTYYTASKESTNASTDLPYPHPLYMRTYSSSSNSCRSPSPSPRPRPPPTPPIYDYVDYTTRLRRRPARASFGRTYQERYGNNDLSASDGDQDGPGSPLSSLDSSDMSPPYTYDSIKYALRDVDEQFRQKSERKRERNRLAAAKCRKRKMDKIGTLGQQVDQLRAEVEYLEGTAAFLRRQIWHFKHELLTHLDHGCLIAEVPFAPATLTVASSDSKASTS